MMLESFMGDDNFQLGIQRFLETYKFANAATADLWKSLQVRRACNNFISFLSLL